MMLCVCLSQGLFLTWQVKHLQPSNFSNKLSTSNAKEQNNATNAKVQSKAKALNFLQK